MLTLFNLGHTISHHASSHHASQHATHVLSNSSSTTSASRRSQRTYAIETVVVVLLPWLLFVLILCLFVFAYEQFPALVWSLFAASMLLALLLVVAGEVSTRNWRLALGAFIASSISMAVPIGLFIANNYMKDYWRLDNGAEYTNVDPMDPSASRSDGTVLKFKTGTVVDKQKSIGFMRADVVYCVAPVVHRGQMDSGPIQYWAAGKNCCDQRGGFACDNVDDSIAIGGLTIYDGDGIYRSAVRMAESVYGLTPALTAPLLVEWVRDAMVIKDGMWYGAASLVMVATAVHLVLSGMIGLLIVKYLPK